MSIVKPKMIIKKQEIKKFTGYVCVVRVDDDGITVLPKMVKNPPNNVFVLSFSKLYRVNLDEKTVEETSPRKTVKPFNQIPQEKRGLLSMFSKKEQIMTSLNVLFVHEQYHEDLSEVLYLTLCKNLVEAKLIKKEEDVSEIHIEARTSNNKRAMMKGGVPFGMALRMIKGKAGLIKSALTSEAKQMGKDIAKDEIKQKLHGGKFPDIVGDAQKLVKFTMNLPANGYKVIKSKGKALLKAIKGGDYKKAKKCCDDLEKECNKKSHKGGNCGLKHKGGKSQKGGCGSGKKTCGGAKEFDIHSKVNQEFGKALNKQFKNGADKIKKQQQKNKKDMDTIRKFKSDINALPLKSFGNLKSKTQQQSKKDMIKKQDKKLLAKKQANLKLSKDIKKLENEVFGMFR